MIIGSHVGMKAPDYYAGAVKEALSYEANALMLYTGAPQNTRRIPAERMKIREGRELLAQAGIDPEHVIVHAPYIINPANSTNEETAAFAMDFLYREIQRTAEIGSRYLVLHPGAYTTTDPATGLKAVTENLERLGDYPEDVMICLETMAGKGTELGTAFEQLAQLLENTRYPSHFGICLDTCHIHDAGYDMHDFDGILDEFDHVIGLEHLKVIHLNDSRNPRGSRKDRHANIGMGMIGFEALYRAAHNIRTEHVPKILETPYVGGNAPYGTEIAMLKSGMFAPERLNAPERKELL